MESVTYKHDIMKVIKQDIVDLLNGNLEETYDEVYMVLMEKVKDDNLSIVDEYELESLFEDELSSTISVIKVMKDSFLYHVLKGWYEEQGRKMSEYISGFYDYKNCIYFTVSYTIQYSLVGAEYSLNDLERYANKCEIKNESNKVNKFGKVKKALEEIGDVYEMGKDGIYAHASGKDYMVFYTSAKAYNFVLYDNDAEQNIMKLYELSEEEVIKVVEGCCY